MKPIALTLDRRLLNVKEYHKMAEVGILEEKGVELIQGEIFNMSPIGSEHAAMVNHFNQLLVQALGATYLISIQNPVQLGNLSEPEPDIAILKAKADFYRDGHPQAKDVLAIIEVADTSLVYDREIKGKLYAEAGIAEYYLINLLMQNIEVYQSPEPNGYTFTQQVKKGEMLLLQYFNLEIDTSTIWG